MTAGRVKKEYLAVVRGTPDPPSGRIVLPLGRDAADRRRVVVRSDGAYCETLYETIGEPEAGTSLIKCRLVTGRTHQIRVHLAGSGCPILGDAVYGEIDARISRPALHAWRIELPHPVTRQSIVAEAAPPRDMIELLGPTLMSATMSPDPLTRL
jgi:23S rRNA pseudouridine1911/1915/1917 synthase